MILGSAGSTGGKSSAAHSPRLLADHHHGGDRDSPSFPRSSVGMPSATLGVVFDSGKVGRQRTRSVPDGIPTRSVGTRKTRFTAIYSKIYGKTAVVIREKCPFACHDFVRRYFCASTNSRAVV